MDMTACPVRGLKIMGARIGIIESVGHREPAREARLGERNLRQHHDQQEENQ